MTDFQNWWDGYFHEINGQKETAQAAWQARGELDAVRIKELEAINKQLEFRLDAWHESSINAVQRVNELSAKLDKAREAIKNLIVENVSNREYNSSKSIYNTTAENKAVNLLEELDK